MREIVLDELFNVGLHYGHKKEHSKPMVKPFVYTIQDGVCIFDLAQTKSGLEAACAFLQKSAQNGQTILLVGTKKQAKPLIHALAKELNLPHITNRWLGGLLTNFTTVRQSLDQLARLEKVIATPEFAKLKKGEQKRITDEADKLHRSFDGIKDLTRVPDVMFVLDGNTEKLALDEAQRLGVTVVATIDSDGDPTKVEYAIPMNDDAPRGLKYALACIGEAIAEGQGSNFTLPEELVVDSSTAVKIKKTGTSEDAWHY